MTAIETPCNEICAIDPTAALCVGCGRSLGEIENWGRLTADQRRSIMAELPRRLATLHALQHAPVNAS